MVDLKKKKFIVLGANGFLGSQISKFLKQSDFEVETLEKKKFNFLDKSTFVETNFSDSIIIDCIVKIDGTHEEKQAINNKGLEDFLTYVKQHHTGFRYIYFSTISTKIPQLVEENDYVKSKFNAENYLRSINIDYQIIRLAFLIGKGSARNRLFPMLINKLKLNEALTIDNVQMNITSLYSFNKCFIDLLLSNEKEINFTDGKVYSLYNIVTYLAHELSSASEINFNKDKMMKITCKAYKEKIDFQEDVYKTLNEMCHEN